MSRHELVIFDVGVLVDGDRITKQVFAVLFSELDLALMPSDRWAIA